MKKTYRIAKIFYRFNIVLLFYMGMKEFTELLDEKRMQQKIWHGATVLLVLISLIFICNIWEIYKKASKEEETA